LDSFLYSGVDWRIELGFVPVSWRVYWRIEIGFVPVSWSRLENRARIRSCILESMLENRDRIRYMFYSLLRCLIYFKSECTIHNGTL